MEIPQWTRVAAVAALPFIASPTLVQAADVETITHPSNAVVGELFAEGELGAQQKRARDVLSSTAKQILGGIYGSLKEKCPVVTVESLVPRGGSVDGIQPHVETVSHYTTPAHDELLGHTVTASFGSDTTGYVIVDPQGPEGIACMGRYIDEQNIRAASALSYGVAVACNVHADFKQLDPGDAAALFVSCGSARIPNPTSLMPHHNHQPRTTPSFVRS